MNFPMIAVGIVFLVGAFTYRGMYNRVFARSGQPENPPTLIGRILLFLVGTLVLAMGMSERLRLL
jgi:ABC-type Na+ efflux pump permease subunit